VPGDVADDRLVETLVDVALAYARARGMADDRGVDLGAVNLTAAGRVEGT
jgi:hypothetical protein